MKKTEKNISSLPIFKAQIKEKLLSVHNQLDYFWIGEVNKKQPRNNAQIYLPSKVLGDKV